MVVGFVWFGSVQRILKWFFGGNRNISPFLKFQISSV